MRALLACLLLTCTGFGELADSVKALAAVGLEGGGNIAATKAWRETCDSGPAALPHLLDATGRGTPVADNWLRLAGEVIVDRALEAKQPVPLALLEERLLQPQHPAAARILARDLIARIDAARVAELDRSLLNDTVQELRRAPVQAIIDSAKDAAPADALRIYQQALQSVRDEDQTRFLAERLKALGAPVDLRRHFGFLTKWKLIGPFPNVMGAGFDTVFPPETSLDFQATYPGKEKPVQWQAYESADEYGKIDLNKPLGLLKEATAYAATTFHSPEERAAELRLGCKNAWKIWLNGVLLFGRDEYHRGQQMDQYILPCTLKKGANSILVKACQNEQTEIWTVEWEFQLRVCDSAGTALHSAPEIANH